MFAGPSWGGAKVEGYNVSEKIYDQGWNKQSSIQIETMCYAACLNQLGSTWEQTKVVAPKCENQTKWKALLKPFISHDSAMLSADDIQGAGLSEDLDKLEQNCVVGPFTKYKTKHSQNGPGFPNLTWYANSYFQVVGSNRADSGNNAIAFKFTPPNPHIGSPPKCYCIQSCPFYTCARGIEPHASVHDCEPAPHDLTPCARALAGTSPVRWILKAPFLGRQ